ncbi:hypothetical protein DPMN_128243 [Dreissena polymorpha]|uniref:WAP domain-containing protein n=1 Tax=Dreissena polymorpha TaxID=45954 RepID=A0A9D4H0H1_DREPO|nr:hypothetical protein DPMN_128243 [Dreissena polymorpha]
MHMLLQLCLVYALIVECSAQKPGACPPGGIRITVCMSDCETDRDCPGAQKCCKYSSCMFTCEKPIFGKYRPTGRP